MREGSSSGVSPYQKADEYLTKVAERLKFIEEAGAWPDELIKAYVAMIPKAAGGSRPEDQRPVTVLDVVYRVWAKCVVMAWVPVLHREYLTGPHRNGFPGPVRYVALGATSAGPDLAAETSGATIVAFVF